MIKATLLLVGVLALSWAATLDTIEKEGCQHNDQLWACSDLTKFLLCLPGTNTSIEQSCPPNKFFVKNATVSGCLPHDVVDPRCVNTRSVEPEPCQGKNLWQPQVSNDPTQFYLCPGEGASPIKMACAEGTAYLNEKGYLGCFLWSLWRWIKECPE